jgi:hypothetical protein
MTGSIPEKGLASGSRGDEGKGDASLCLAAGLAKSGMMCRNEANSRDSRGDEGKGDASLCLAAGLVKSGMMCRNEANSRVDRPTHSVPPADAGFSVKY